MIFAGIDVGGKNAHVVICKDDTVIAKGEVATGIKKGEAAEALFDETLRRAGLSRQEIMRVYATGCAGRRVTCADGYLPDAAADARGVYLINSQARTCIDVGAEEGRAIRLGEGGRIVDFAINEKCAAGAGAFVEAMARALEITVEEMAEISLRSTKTIPMNAQCAVFGESEVVSLIHQNVGKEDIAKAVHDAIAARIASVARIVGVEEPVVVIGGMARNKGFIHALERELRVQLIIPPDPEFVGALGACLAAAAGVQDGIVASKVLGVDGVSRGVGS